MAKQSILTRADYQERRVSLDALLSEARAHHAQASYRLEMDGGPEDEVTKARANMSALEDRLSVLDAAWKHAQEARADEIAASELQARKDAAAIIDKAIAKRASAVTRIAAQLEPLGEMIKEIEAADDAIVRAAQPYLELLDVGALRASLSGFSEMHTPVITSCLMRARVKVHALRANIDTHKLLDGGLEPVLARSEKIIRGATCSIAPGGE